MNRDQLRNPHRIYPGDMLVLDRSGAQLRMRLETSRVGPRDAHRAARRRRDPDDPAVGDRAVPVEAAGRERERARRARREIVATQEDRVALGPGNVAYVRGVASSDETRWQIFRRGDPLVDPGHEAAARLRRHLSRRGGAAAPRRDQHDRDHEGRAGNLSRRPAACRSRRKARSSRTCRTRRRTRCSGRIVSTYGGLWETGPLAIVTLSQRHARRARSRPRAGDPPRPAQRALRASAPSRCGAARARPATTSAFPTTRPICLRATARSSRARRRCATSDFAQLPAERYGLLLVFRTFDRASFALVMQASRPVAVSDIITNP